MLLPFQLVAVDKGACNLEFIGSIQMLRDNPYYTQLPSDAIITGLKTYAGGQTNTATNCWAFTENKIYEIQADNGYIAVPLAIDAAYATTYSTKTSDNPQSSRASTRPGTDFLLRLRRNSITLIVTGSLITIFFPLALSIHRQDSARSVSHVTQRAERQH